MLAQWCRRIYEALPRRAAEVIGSALPPELEPFEYPGGDARAALYGSRPNAAPVRANPAAAHPQPHAAHPARHVREELQNGEEQQRQPHPASAAPPATAAAKPRGPRGGHDSQSRDPAASRAPSSLPRPMSEGSMMPPPESDVGDFPGSYSAQQQQQHDEATGSNVAADAFPRDRRHITGGHERLDDHVAGEQRRQQPSDSTQRQPLAHQQQHSEDAQSEHFSHFHTMPSRQHNAAREPSSSHVSPAAPGIAASHILGDRRRIEEVEQHHRDPHDFNSDPRHRMDSIPSVVSPSAFAGEQVEPSVNELSVVQRFPREYLLGPGRAIAAALEGRKQVAQYPSTSSSMLSRHENEAADSTTEDLPVGPPVGPQPQTIETMDESMAVGPQSVEDLEPAGPLVEDQKMEIRAPDRGFNANGGFNGAKRAWSERGSESVPLDRKRGNEDDNAEWSMHVDDHGRTYYKNHRLRTTAWTLPVGARLRAKSPESRSTQHRKRQRSRSQVSSVLIKKERLE